MTTTWAVAANSPVVDIHEDPAGGCEPGVAAPTLVKNRPLPARRLVGDLSDTARCCRARSPRRADGTPTGIDPGARACGSTPTEPVDGDRCAAAVAEAEDTLRAIGAGEVDAFVVSDGDGGRRVFTLSTADRPYRMFVENMRDGAATLSSSGLILYANRRLAELLACPRETIVGSPLARFVAGGARLDAADPSVPTASARPSSSTCSTATATTVPVLVGTLAARRRRRPR